LSLADSNQNLSPNNDDDLAEVLCLVESYIEKPNTELIKKAYYFSKEKHTGQKRKSGEPYITHPVAVTKLLAQFSLDEEALAAGLLHDTVEDTPATLKEIEKQFTEPISIMVDGVTKLNRLNFVSKKEKLADNFRKMIFAMSKDIRVILIKLADRTHNMQTLSHMATEKQKIIAQETLDIYAPLANRLGIFWIKSTLEDLALRHLKPETYYMIVSKVNQRKADREGFIQDVLNIVELKLQSLNFSYDITGRPKHFYSIFKKMMYRNIAFEQVSDLFAFRILVDTIPHCYEALGVIHSLWKPVPGRFKDYIAMPKPNNYQSLHTTVIGPQGEQVEFQIRTNDMHEICEHGIAAHWAYKEKRKKLSSVELDSFKWLKQMVQWRDELVDPNEFLESIQSDLFENVAYCFTPNGDVLELPTNATPLDFAFHIHTDVGIHCAGAKINNRMAPLRTPLKSGDTVEIITSKNQHPTKDWLKYITTSKARNKIRSYLKTEEREQSRKLGRELLSKEFDKHKVSLDEQIKTNKLQSNLKVLKCNSVEELFAKIGYGKIEAKDIVKKIIPQDIPPPDPQEKLETMIKQPTEVKTTSDISIDGIDDILVKLGKCCTPLPGEEIVGFITRGRGVTIHRANCGWALAIDPDRKVHAEWNTKKKLTYLASIKIITADQTGILANITKIISTLEVNILKADIVSTEEGKGILVFDVQVHNLKELEEIINKIELVKGVYTVQRVYR